MTWTQILDWIGTYLWWASNPAWWALGLSVISFILAIVAVVRTRLPRISLQTEPADAPEEQNLYLLRNVGRTPLTNIKFLVDPILIDPCETNNPNFLQAAFRKPRFCDATLDDPPTLLPKQSVKFRAWPIPDDRASGRLRSRVLLHCDQDPGVFSVELPRPGRLSPASVRCAKTVVRLYSPWNKAIDKSIETLHPTFEKLVDVITAVVDRQPEDEDYIEAPEEAVV